jgi:CubicO group peptidase (beta-lactamase class C family)
LPKIPSNLPLPGLTKVLKEFIANSKNNSWNSSTNSFSVVATSPEQTFFRYHYTAPLRNNSGVDKVDGDTVYRVASVTKVFTVLAIWLEERMNLDDLIGKYVKELDIPGWEDVTLRLLTSQMAAIPRDGMSLLASRSTERC